ncbi:MAG TPA: NfeD family protein [Rhodanobacteraceae bacterium]|jgi:membrane protein implicated in regulation of membrane protease activity
MSFPLHYLWWVLALVLIAGEVLLPGYFLLWIGIGAAAMGVITMFMPALGILPQAIGFVVLAFLACVLYWRWVRPRLEREADADSALLNRRGARMIGQRYVLETAIVNGRGKARVGDGQWLVEGPDLPAGTTVEVVGVEGTALQVRAAE